MMNSEVIELISKYFSIREIVSEIVYKRFGSFAWRFFDVNLLEVMLWIREGLGKPIYVNNWYKGGILDERGLRCNLDELMRDKTKQNIVYCTPHSLGKAMDFEVDGMTSEQVRNWIRANKYKCPHPIRLEKDVKWVHLDTCNITDDMIEEFKA